MNIILKTLSLRNFKGVSDLTINFEWITNIFGANESGKSTVYTAFTWLLTGKDEFDRKDYEIKNTVRKELNSQAHEVEGIFDIDGREVKLKRVYLENWEKPRGQAQKVFKGHYTDFWINDVPVSPKEYQTTVDDFINPKYIKLITNPTYFNSLHWEDQRRGLIAIAGEITNADVFNVIATPANDFAALIAVLNSNKSIEKWKAELSAKKLLLKKAAVEYLPRIDEAKRNMPEAKNWSAIEKEIKKIESEVGKIDTWLSDQSQALSEKQKESLEKQRQLHSKQTQLTNIRYKVKQDLLSNQSDISQQISKVQRQITEISNYITQLKKGDNDRLINKEAYQKQIEAKNALIATLRSDWDKINAERFEFDESKCECPTCKQLLPQDQIENKREELLKNFNASMMQRKAEKVAQSNQVKSQVQQLQENITALDSCDNAAGIENQKSNLTALELKLSELQAAQQKQKVDNIELAVDALLKVNADALNLQDEISKLETEISSGSEDVNADKEKYISRKAECVLQLDGLKKQIATKEVIENTEARIQQLQLEETANAQAIADIEQQEFDLEAFIRAKMDILEQRVNKMFRYVSFRLFEKQVNGAIVESCVCEYNGVPYPTLNTAAKLLAGLDIIETITTFYKVHAPVFCDNRESVTFIPDVNSQIISLFVSPADKKLRVETVEEASMALA